MGGHDRIRLGPDRHGSELKGLVFGLQEREVEGTAAIPWFKSPVVVGTLALVVCAVFYVYIAIV